MGGFIQRFSSDPGLEELIRIEGVDIIDRTPPANIIGQGSGTACIVGEFENGPFAAPTEVLSANDLLTTFGGFGYTYAGVSAQNPCARKRLPDGAVVAEFWSGNGFIGLVGKQFKRLIICRVDTSVGTVTFNRLANLVGAAFSTFTLANGQHLDFKHDGGSTQVTTFSAAAAQMTGSGGTFGMTNGDNVTFNYDAQPNFTVLFDGTESTVTAVAAKINLYAGFTFATTGSGQLILSGVTQGTSGQVTAVSASSGVATKLGLTVPSTVNGTGNVANILAVTPTEIDAAVHATQSGTHVDVKSNGAIRIYSTTTSTGSMQVINTTTATALGFPYATNDIDDGLTGVIPAGTILETSGKTTVVVTMQDINVAAGNPGPYSVKVRHATDDGSGASTSSALSVDASSPIDLDDFAVSTTGISNALSESAIDAQYVAAINSTVNVATVAAQINLIWAARASNTIRRNLKANADLASDAGCRGRMAFVRPPFNSTVTASESTSDPGVGAYRDERVAYCYPALNITVPAIALLGLNGGTGFTADGGMDVGSDGWLASVCSQLNPEENPGQITTFMDLVNGLENGEGNSAGSAVNVQGFTIDTYKSFRASGIAAPRVDGGSVFFQSGVTSVDPSLFPQLRNIARRRMADFIQDSLAVNLKSHIKKLMTRARRRAIKSSVEDFLLDLQSPTNDDLQRIQAFSVTDKNNTVAAIAAGIYRLTIKVQTLPSLDVLVLDTTIGETVDVTLAG